MSTQKLISKANDSSITDYNSGNKGEMFTFTHPTTSQTPGLTDYRYIGNTPNNYVKFNDEIWRIIGVFKVQTENNEWEDRIKIIRNTSIGNIIWDSNKQNNWPNSSLYSTLNIDYYNRNGSYSSTGLTDISKNQIAPVIWYLGGTNTNAGLGAREYYSFERGTVVYSGHSCKTSANIGLIYPSDYIYTYAYGVDDDCYTNAYYCNSNNSTGANNSWLFNSNIQWTITSGSKNSNAIVRIEKNGNVLSSTISSTYNVRPSVYLRPDIEFISGTGASNNPYQIK